MSTALSPQLFWDSDVTPRPQSGPDWIWQGFLSMARMLPPAARWVRRTDTQLLSPGGTVENSPALQCWARATNTGLESRRDD